MTPSHRQAQPACLKPNRKNSYRIGPLACAAWNSRAGPGLSCNRVGLRANLLAQRFVRLFMEYNFNV